MTIFSYNEQEEDNEELVCYVDDTKYKSCDECKTMVDESELVYIFQSEDGYDYIFCDECECPITPYDDVVIDYDLCTMKLCELCNLIMNNERDRHNFNKFQETIERIESNGKQQRND